MTANDDATIVDVPRFDESSPNITGAEHPTVLASRYELLGLLGSGGMGTVYRARDRELDEIVALKVLRQEIAAAPGMLERFRREVKLARRVTHRNVARMFDIGEHGGDRFLTMELVEGEPLSARAAQGRMSPARVIHVAREILEGLAASHDAGVVHGDLKPENVILTNSDRVVITDFGIARALSPDPNDPRTAAGAIVGTPAYMAPEQVEGVRDLDGRADIYALGCMMFRLLTGQPPWTGTSIVSLAAARLTREPPDPRTIVSDIPADLAELVLRAMARDRNERFASAREALVALGGLGKDAATTAVIKKKTERATPTKTVAVLPITNQGAAEDAYLASGLTDDLIDVLSGVAGLRVRPRGAAARHAALEQDPQRAGRALDVDVVIEGSVRRSGEMLRTTLRVVTVNDGFQLWARRFERPAAAFLSIADEAAKEIAEVLASEKTAKARSAPTDATALDLFLRGRFVFVSNSFDVAKAVPLLRAAHERSPNDTRIAGTYALALMRQYFMESLPDDVAETARATAAAALAREPDASEARVALALVHSASGDPVAMAKELRRALLASPDSPDALLWMGSLLSEVGRAKEAIVLHRRAQASDPSFAMIPMSLARCYALLGDWEAAEAMSVQGPERNDAQVVWITRARLTLWRGDREQAAKLLAILDAQPMSAMAKYRISRLLEIVRDGTVSPENLQAIEQELGAVRNPRRAAFNMQLRVELFCRGSRVDAARALLPELDRLKFIDLTWIDLCPAIEALRGTPELTALRDSTLARVTPVHAVLDAENVSLVA